MIKIQHVAGAVAALGLMAAAGAASALTITYPIPLGDGYTLPNGQVMVADFNQGQATNNPFLYPTLLPGYEMELNGATVGFNEGGGGYSGTIPDPNPNNDYLTVIPNGSASLSAVRGFRRFSFFMGSPDDYNSIKVYGFNGNLLESISGTTLVAGDTNQQWSYGRRINIDLDGSRAYGVTFSSTNYSFELDNIAVGGIPEPGTWALMILGFGGAGAMLRRRRVVAA